MLAGKVGIARSRDASFGEPEAPTRRATAIKGRKGESACNLFATAIFCSNLTCGPRAGTTGRNYV